MKYTEEQFNSIIAQFRACDLPKSQWTHEAHILVAFWHIVKFNEAEALNHVREGIRNYNTAVGTINNDTSGYHETMTVFWMNVVQHFLNKGVYPSTIAAVNAFIDAGYADKTLPLKFYSNDTLFSKEARREWVAPDKISISTLAEIIRQPVATRSHPMNENP